MIIITIGGNSGVFFDIKVHGSVLGEKNISHTFYEWNFEVKADQSVFQIHLESHKKVVVIFKILAKIQAANDNSENMTCCKVKNCLL